MTKATLYILPPIALAWHFAEASEGATLDDLSDTEKLALVDYLPMRAPLDQALALCPRLEKRGRKYDEHYEAATALFEQPTTLWCDFRAGCLFQIIFELRSVPAHAATEIFLSAVAQYSARYGATETVEVNDPEGNAVTASWCTSDYGIHVSCGRDDPAGIMIVYQYWCAENPESVESWKHGWSCDERSN